MTETPARFERIHIFPLILGAFLFSGCTTMSWTKQSMIGVYEFSALNCPAHASYPDKLSTHQYSLTKHVRQIRCENSKTYKFLITNEKRSESAVVSVIQGETCKVVVALVLGREDSDSAYEKSRLDSSQAHAVELAQFFAERQQITLGTATPQATIVNAVIDKKANGAICRSLK